MGEYADDEVDRGLNEGLWDEDDDLFDDLGDDEFTIYCHRDAEKFERLRTLARQALVKNPKLFKERKK